MLGRTTKARIRELLLRRREGGYTRGLYTEEQLGEILAALEQLATQLGEQRGSVKAAEPRFTEQDVLCIAYPDHVSGDESSPLANLRRLFNDNLAGLYSHLHILPHFPCRQIHTELSGPASRADGGFEPMCYQMDPKYGELDELGKFDARLMFDFVLNHLSTEGEWFRRFLEDAPGYRDFFITVPEEKLDELDLAPVFRPRTHHPLFSFSTPKGDEKHVWCTFSASQADINIKNPKVFIRIMEALTKDFIGAGASWVRLDAVGYLVKMLGIEPGEPTTSCFGIQETHDILEVMHLFLADAAPEVTLVAEVNATKDVIATYYGSKGEEAHMVYEFPLAPLSLYAIYTEDVAPLVGWARERLAHPDRVGLAFTASHDGIGVLPMRDVPPLPDGTPALDKLISEISARGGAINTKTAVVDGESRQTPYEACITWTQACLTPSELEALTEDQLDDAQLDLIADRIIASQSFALVAPHCLPADYLGSIAALLNDETTFAVTKHNRDKNRGAVVARDFEQALVDPRDNRQKLLKRVFDKRSLLLRARRSLTAFSPSASCSLDLIEAENTDGAQHSVFAILRRAPDDGADILAVTNSSAHPITVRFSRKKLGLSRGDQLRDCLSERTLLCQSDHLELTLRPWQVAWLQSVKAGATQPS